MADHVQPDAGEEREVSSSGLLLSVDPLQGEKNYKLTGDDSDSDKGGLLGDDGSDSDGSDSDLLGGDDDGSDASDADGTDAGDSDGSDALGGGDSDSSDATDADGSDAGGIGADSDSADSQMNPLGIGDTNVDGPEGGAARTQPIPPPDGDGEDG
jgi:hypothetical protein